jgi:hypothetical protein
MSTEWDLMKSIAHANNNCKQDELAKIITSNCFMGMKNATTIAISSFELTDDNIKKHSEAAIKLAKLKEPEPFIEGLRHALLVYKLTELGLVT